MRKNEYPYFPDDFLWAGAQAASQADGAYGVDGKKASVSDIQPFQKGMSNAEIQALSKQGMTLAEIQKNLADTEHYYPKRHGINFYHTYESDLELLAEAGLKAFRTSIDWSRVFPNGDDKEPNEVALAHYEKMIDKMLELGIEPIITMMHYEMPIHLTLNYGGWVNKNVIDMFVKYGQVLLDRFGDKVKYWILINQINMIQVEPYLSLGIASDQYVNTEEAMYQAVHNQMVACAKIQQYAKAMHRTDLHIGTMIADGTVYPNSCRPDDVVLAMWHNRMQYLFTDVAFRGEYPQVALNYFAEHDLKIEMSEEELLLLKNNTLDYMAISYYFSQMVDASKNNKTPHSISVNENLKANDWGWNVDPQGLYNTLSQYWDRYQKPILIAENGFGNYDKLEDGQIHDEYRSDYLSAHIEQISRAIYDGADVFGYCMWAPIDIVSCSSQQMSKRYGIVFVDIDDEGNGTRKRYKKDSFTWYKNLIASNGREI
ncbi:glycoside hydrolase family 1 protein [Companilactobacillus ginsenosidimutans]|uniref:Beta-glucosidase n=1 Tax=Companilactobacillus ginsenosidimutans TaxID=1007676 RepID=A0A0H4QHL2_9LACO|nr:glycoside hydrolase family 1 protein [Companilactobacillus ginsenosidimutans]AKP67432.1 beta-glucosidase [Companilactobacillus ginsenosidimutans]